MFFKQPNKSSAFTLIEIIVVCAIIALLSTVAYSSFDDSRKQARDKIRQSDLRQLQLALELYKDKYGRYPEKGCGSTWAGPGPQPFASSCSTNNYIIGAPGREFVPDFISKLPTDPNQEMELGKGYQYTTDSSGSYYKVVILQTVESLVLSSFNDEFARCPDSTIGFCINAFTQSDRTSYWIYSSGAEGL